MTMYFDGSGYYMKQHEENNAFFGMNQNNDKSAIKEDANKRRDNKVRAKNKK